jgi:hypothetical protein
MSYVMAAPEMLSAAATDVAAVGSAVSAAHLTAVAPTVGLIPAAADEVSASIAQVFSRAAQEYQALAGKAAAFQQQFVQHLNASAGSYAAAEAANAASLLHLNASAGAAASAISASPGQFLNTLTTVANTFTTLATGFFNLLHDLGSLAYIVTYYALVVAYEFLALAGALLKTVLTSSRVPIPSLPF